MKTNIDKWIHMKTNEDNACQTGYQTRFCVLELKALKLKSLEACGLRVPQNLGNIFLAPKGAALHPL